MKFLRACNFVLALSCAQWLSTEAFLSIRRSSKLFSFRIAANRSDEPTILSNAEISRYSRHLVLSEVGMQGQVALKDSSVLVIGAGGLGSPCLLYLAAAGVGQIGIVDADFVDESNLQRQIIHGTSTIGTSKCESAKSRICDINPHVAVRVYEEEFTSNSALRILKDGFNEKTQYDVVVDGSDNFPTKYLINDACEIHNLPWVYSAILAFEGQLSVFNYNEGPTYRDMLPTPPSPGDVPSCAEGGVLGVLPGTMGCLQATEVLKILLKKQPNEITSGRVLVFDALHMKFSELGIAKDTNRQKIISLIDYQGFCSGPAIKDQHTGSSARTMDEGDTVAAEENPSFQSIEPKQCLERLSKGWAPWVLDVRLRTEHDIVALPFTDEVAPHRTVKINNVPKSGDILVYCKAGVRGKKACNRLIQLGVDPKRLHNLDGGIMKWQREVDPTMPTY